MNVVLPKGVYVVAVSGGIDSVVLLHMLATAENNAESQYVIAHFDHGIRTDSHLDLNHVKELAVKYGLLFESERKELGADASEATARTARYDFLRRIKSKHQALAIITGHHQDDLLETMLLNVARGTGRRGLDPMRSTNDIMRPLINHRKKDLALYANKHTLQWREDSTNVSTKYARNALRAGAMKKMGHTERQKLIGINVASQVRNNEISSLLAEMGDYIFAKNHIIRARAVTLPTAVLQELVFEWLERSYIANIDKSMVHRVILAIKTLPAGKKTCISAGTWLVSHKSSLNICTNDQIQPV